MGVAALILAPACAARWPGSIGAVLAKDNQDGRVFVREAPEDMGAARAGLHAGDEVVAVDGVPVREMSPSALHRALAGDVGSSVTLTVARDGTSRDVKVERGPLRGAEEPKK